MISIGFGGGCHWCTEAVFDALNGVSNVKQGFIRSHPPNDGWSEAVLLEADESVVALTTLIDIHLKTHAAYANHSMRGKYRSAIYTRSAHTIAEVTDYLAGLTPKPITQAMPLVDFKLSDERFHNYYGTDPKRPFCRTYIEPKLDRLREKPELLISQRR